MITPSIHMVKDGDFQPVGRMMTAPDNIEVYKSWTDDESALKFTLIQKKDEEELKVGQIVRFLEYGTDYEEDANGRPVNYASFVIDQIGYTALGIELKRGKTQCTELLTKLKNTPLRSAKIYSQGRYTWRQILQQTGAFREIVGNPVLDQKNEYKEYTDATLYDLVTDIARTLGVRARLELQKRGGWVVPVLYMDNRNVREYVNSVPKSYFNWANVIASSATRENAAQRVISNVTNLSAENAVGYPYNSDAVVSGLYPNRTNIDNSWAIFTVPDNIREIRAVRVYYYHAILNPENPETTVYPDGTEGWRKAWKLANKIHEGYVYTNPLTNEKDTGFTNGTASEKLERGYYMRVSPEGERFFGGETPQEVMAVRAALYGGSVKDMQMHFYLAEESEYKYLLEADDELKRKFKKNTLWYRRGTNELHLEALFGHGIVVKFPGKWSSFEAIGGAVFMFAENPSAPGDFYAIGVDYVPMLDGMLSSTNSDVETGITSYYNQYSQNVDAAPFMRVLKNAANSMREKIETVGKKFVYNGTREQWDACARALPNAGSIVYGEDRNYVVTNMSLTIKPGSGEIIAQLSPYQIGQSNLIKPSSAMNIYGIPLQNQKPSVNYTKFTMRLSDTPLPYTAGPVFKDDLISAFLNPLVPYPVPKTDYVPKYALIRFWHKSGAKKDFLFMASPILSGSCVVYNFKTLTNTTIALYDGQPILYTDENGEVEAVRVFLLKSAGSGWLDNYPILDVPVSDPELAENSAVIAYDFFIEQLDAAEIFQHEIMLEVTGNKTLLIGGYLQYGGFTSNHGGKDEIVYEGIEIVYADRKLNPDETVREENILERQPVSFVKGTVDGTLEAAITPRTAEYLSWAIVKRVMVGEALWENRILLLDNVQKIADTVTDGKMILYYGFNVERL